MPRHPTLQQLLNQNFTLDIEPFPDAPLNAGDVLIYADRLTGRVLVARAPIAASAKENGSQKPRPPHPPFPC